VRVHTGDLVDTYARSAFEDTPRKAEKFGARGTTSRRKSETSLEQFAAKWSDRTVTAYRSSVASCCNPRGCDTFFTPRFVAAGHYATETSGVQALARRIADEFRVKSEFIDLPNPV
jgi:hypothetical protein